MKAPQLPAIWLVSWRDAHVKLGDPGETECIQRSVGWRVKCPRGYVRIAQSVCEGDLEDCLTIPTPMVKSIVVLRAGQPAKQPAAKKRRGAL